jgi:hypothetical protein
VKIRLKIDVPIFMRRFMLIQPEIIYDSVEFGLYSIN